MFEIQILALSGLLAAGQLIVFSALANRELPQSWLIGPRDDPMPTPLSPLCARMQRAFNNQMEGLVLFAVAAVSVVLLRESSTITGVSAIVYLAARVIYVPAYCLGVPWVRSIVWMVGFAATVVMLGAALR
ncbi:MAG: MAPEG family protein [Pseudomonadota bacterium]